MADTLSTLLSRTGHKIFAEAGKLAIKRMVYVSGELADDLTLTDAYPSILVLDCGGTGRTVTLDPEETNDGAIRLILNNSSGAETLTIEDDTATPVEIGTVAQSEMALYYCRAGAWIQVFKLASANPYTA